VPEPLANRDDPARIQRLDLAVLND